MGVAVTSAALEAMRVAARAAYPREACGILLGERLGEDARISEARETANVHPRAHSHFEIDPQALIDAHREERCGGSGVLGYFHSHPGGPAEPSATDRAMAAHDGRIWAIVGAGGVCFWRDEAAGFRALSYRVLER